MKTNTKSKSKTVQAIPDGYHTVTPFLMLDNAQEFLSFIEKAFDAHTEFVMKDEHDKIIHASAKIGNSPVMLGDTMDGQKPTSGVFYLYVENADNAYNQAVAVEGAKSTRELRDEYYGDRAGCVEDKWGNHWWLATHTEDVSEEELKERHMKLLTEEHA